MSDVYIASVGMIPFKNYVDAEIKQLTAKLMGNLFKHSDIEQKALQAAWFSNSCWGISTGQHCIRGQVALAPLGFQGIPIINVENACASGSTALYGAYTGIKAGMYDCALAIGVEKSMVPKNATPEQKKKGLEAFIAGTDVEVTKNLMKMMEEHKKKAAKKESGGGEKEKARSPFMDFYSMAARAHMQKYGTTQEMIATIAAKNHFHGSLNPDAQYQFDMTVEEVINDVSVAFPLTRAMCAPTGDGAAAAILVSEDYLKKLPKSTKAVKIASIALGSAIPSGADQMEKELVQQAYEQASIGPGDIDLAEVHDASAFGELAHTETLGFCDEGMGGEYALSGATKLGGSLPVNPSGGLECRGHPIGASGLAQIAECVYQLRGQAGKRQVEGARRALTQNGGGMMGAGEASMVISILEACQ